MDPLKPGKELQKTIQIINAAMGCSNTSWGPRSVPYWLCFGGLWAIIQNSGIVPDGDLDLCTYYGQDYHPIVAGFQRHGYHAERIVVSDAEPSNALYIGFSHRELPHLCVSFWYEHNGVRYYCHDQHREVHGVGVPVSGYYFKGVLASSVDPDQEMWAMVEWPGIPGSVRIRVPRFPGSILDSLYPAWAYQKQRYTPRDGVVDPTRVVSIHRGGAISPFMVHVKSMEQWGDEKYITGQLAEGEKAWLHRIKESRT